MMGKLIVLCPNPYRDRGLVLAERACAALKKTSFEVAMSPVFVDVPENSKMVPLHESAKNAAMVVSFGGDGTFLHVAREVMGRDVSIVSTHEKSQNVTIRSIIDADKGKSLPTGKVHFGLKPAKVFLFCTDTEERIRF